MGVEKTVIYICIFGVICLLSMATLYPLFELQKYDSRYLYTTQAYGFSMLPTIKSGDLLVVAKKDSPYFNPEPCDILVYIYDENIAVAHRLVAIRGNTYILKGDNNDYYEVVPEERIIGEVVEIIPSDNIIATYVVESLWN